MMNLKTARSIRTTDRESLASLKKDRDDLTIKIADEIMETFEPHEIPLKEYVNGGDYHPGIELSANRQLYVRFTHGAVPFYRVRRDGKLDLPDAATLENFRKGLPTFLQTYATKYYDEVEALKRDVYDLGQVLL